MKKISCIIVLMITISLNVFSKVTLKDILLTHELPYKTSGQWLWTEGSSIRDSVFDSPATKNFAINQKHDSVVVITDKSGFGIIFSKTQSIGMRKRMSEPSAAGFGGGTSLILNYKPYSKISRIKTLTFQWAPESLVEACKIFEPRNRPTTIITFAIIKNGKVTYRTYNSDDKILREFSCPNYVEKCAPAESK